MNSKQLEMLIKQQVPMIGYAGAEITELNNARCVVKIPFKAENKNHLNSMYFGSLAIGADAAGGLLAFHKIMHTGKNISLVFKDFHADFLRRPEQDVFFTCEEGLIIDNLIMETIKTGERVSKPVTITATTTYEGKTEEVAKFVLTLSLKCSNK